MTLHRLDGVVQVGVVLDLVAAALLALAIVGLLARQVWLANQPLVILATFVPLLVVPVAAALVIFAVERVTLGVLAAATVGALVVATQVPLFRVSPAVALDSRAPRLVVMTSNVGMGRADPVGLIGLVRGNGVDVLALQEVNERAVSGLRAAGIDEVFPYSALAPAPGDEGVALWSVFPLSDVTIDRDSPKYRIWARAALGPRFGNRTVTLASVHVMAPWPASAKIWLADLNGLGAELRARAGDVIALGDFNATWDHAPFRGLLIDGFADAVESSGSGWQRTFPERPIGPPLIGIDHVVTRGVVAVGASAVAVPGADHLALLAHLAVPPR